MNSSTATRTEGNKEEHSLTRINAVPGQMITPAADGAFCRSCGASIKREAAICVHCGVANNFRATGYAQYKGGRQGTGEGKSKTAAVVMAIFFGIFSWLYTYREDSGKFWITASITLVNIVLTVLTLGLWVVVALPVGLGFLAWVIIDTASKNDAWYANY